jgi:hypothetical protein
MVIIRYWTVEELNAWDKENGISTGVQVDAGWFFQISEEEDAPHGPWPTEKECQDQWDIFRKKNELTMTRALD